VNCATQAINSRYLKPIDNKLAIKQQMFK